MTDAHLMDADCIHGKTWWECDECEALEQADLTRGPRPCDVEREGRRCDLIARHGGPHMWLNPVRPLVVAWGYTNTDDTNPVGQHASPLPEGKS